MNSWRREYRFALRGAIAILWLAACSGMPPSASAQPAGAETPVKMSRTGICHERGTVHYQQTIYFQPFDSMEACLKAGGRQMGMPLWRRWKERQSQRAFADREKQHWEGHKLEPKRRRR